MACRAPTTRSSGASSLFQKASPRLGERTATARNSNERAHSLARQPRYTGVSMRRVAQMAQPDVSQGVRLLSLPRFTTPFITCVMGLCV